MNPVRCAGQVTAGADKRTRQRVIAIGLAIALLAAAPISARAAERAIGIFATGALADWEHKSFKGETRYRLVGHSATRALEATCDGTASAILPGVRPWIYPKPRFCAGSGASTMFMPGWMARPRPAMIMPPVSMSSTTAVCWPSVRERSIMSGPIANLSAAIGPTPLPTRP